MEILLAADFQYARMIYKKAALGVGLGQILDKPSREYGRFICRRLGARSAQPLFSPLHRRESHHLGLSETDKHKE